MCVYTNVADSCDIDMEYAKYKVICVFNVFKYTYTVNYVMSCVYGVSTHKIYVVLLVLDDIIHYTLDSMYDTILDIQRYVTYIYIYTYDVHINTYIYI